MRKENFSKLRIAEYLGRHLQVVHEALYQLGSINPNRNILPMFRLSESEWDQIETMAGETWLRIARLKFEGRTSRWVQSLYLRQISPDWCPPLELTTADLRHITHVRLTERATYDELAKRYPQWNDSYLMRKFYDKMIEEDAQPASQDPYAHDVARLREEMKSWFEAVKTKYPKLHWKRVFEELHEEHEALENYKTSKRSGFRMSAADCQDVVRLREKGKYWDEIVDLKFPGFHPDAIQGALLRKKQGRTGVRAKEVFGVLSAADRLHITRLRNERKTWAEIAELMFPAWSRFTVRAAYQRPTRTVGRRKFEITAAERLEVARLRDEGMT
jgi:hypothetical protein